VLQCVAVCCSVLQCVAVCCSVLQCVAACCSVLQCVAVCCSAADHDILFILQHTVARCSTWQHAANCNTMQHTATHSSNQVELQSRFSRHGSWRFFSEPSPHFHRPATVWFSLCSVVTHMHIYMCICIYMWIFGFLFCAASSSSQSCNGVI